MIDDQILMQNPPLRGRLHRVKTLTGEILRDSGSGYFVVIHNEGYLAHNAKHAHTTGRSGFHPFCPATDRRIFQPVADGNLQTKQFPVRFPDRVLLPAGVQALRAEICRICQCSLHGI